ncbi:reticulocalbin-3 [Tachysurus ichikawai]
MVHSRDLQPRCDSDGVCVKTAPVHHVYSIYTLHPKPHAQEDLRDGRLSISEIMDNVDVVKVSTITDYGTLVLREHDEL